VDNSQDAKKALEEIFDGVYVHVIRPFDYYYDLSDDDNPVSSF